MGTISWGRGGGSHPSCVPTWPAVLGRGRTTQLGVATGLRSGSKSQGPDFSFVVEYVLHKMCRRSRVRHAIQWPWAHGTVWGIASVGSRALSSAQGKRWTQKSHSLTPPRRGPWTPAASPVSLGTGRPWTFQRRRGSCHTGSFVLSWFHSARPFQDPSVLPAVSLLHPFLWLSNTPFYKRGAHRILIQLTRWFRMKGLFFFFG